MHVGMCVATLGVDYLTTTARWAASLSACRELCSSSQTTDGVDCQAFAYSDNNWCTRVYSRNTPSTSVNSEDECSNQCDSKNSDRTKCSGYRWDSIRGECVLEYQKAVGGDPTIENPFSHISGNIDECFIKSNRNNLNKLKK